MGDLEALTALVEVPTGSRNKYEMDQRLGRIRLDRTLFTATQYPADYGYLLGTIAEDGEPLDALVVVEEPTFPGCEIAVRPIAMFAMHDEDGPDEKILCVPASDPRTTDIQDLDDVSSHTRSAISHFFEVYKTLEPGKATTVDGWRPRAEAERVIGEAQQRRGSAAPA
jgi:inorganic pyrophosphatase